VSVGLDGHNYLNFLIHKGSIIRAVGPCYRVGDNIESVLYNRR